MTTAHAQHVGQTRGPMSHKDSHGVLDTPDMDDLVSDVREQDRALRDGVWVDEYVMLDRGPRQIVGWLVFAVALPVFGFVALFVLWKVVERKPSAGIVLGAVALLGFFIALRRRRNRLSNKRIERTPRG